MAMYCLIFLCTREVSVSLSMVADEKVQEHWVAKYAYQAVQMVENF